MIDPVKAGTIEDKAVDCGSYTIFRSPDRSHGQSLFGLEVSATQRAE